jgi:hypothetical protein
MIEEMAVKKGVTTAEMAGLLVKEQGNKQTVLQTGLNYLLALSEKVKGKSFKEVMTGLWDQIRA